MRFLLPAALPAALVVGLLNSATVQAEEATIYGGTAPMLSTQYSGTFMPAKTGLHCYAIDENKCWDGSAWHEIYPRGTRHYARPSGTVSCIVIMKVSHDCWDGVNWYRLPSGTLLGIVAPMSSSEAGAFRTMPLR